MSGLMALVAVFLVVIGFNYLKIDLSPGPDHGTADISFELDADWDNDGLNNKEESFWGTDPNNSDTDGDSYLDGEEVTSGHDPLIPAPDDKIFTDNLTDRVSKLALAGLYEGSLKPSSPNYEQSLNDLALAAVDTVVAELSGNIDPNRLRVADDSKLNQEFYIEKASPVLAGLLDAFVNQTPKLEDSNNFSLNNTSQHYGNKARRYQQLLEQGYEMEVPNNWVQEHTLLLRTVSSLQVSNEALSNSGEDPLKAAAAFQVIGLRANSISEIFEKFTKKIATENLKYDKFAQIFSR